MILLLSFQNQEVYAENEEEPILKPEMVFCTMDWTPVCSVSGKTYSNMCMMNNAGETLAYEGECAEPKDEIQELKAENLKLNLENLDLKQQIEDLKAVIMEQIKVIMEWITNR